MTVSVSIAEHVDRLKSLTETVFPLEAGAVANLDHGGSCRLRIRLDRVLNGGW